MKTNKAFSSLCTCVPPMPPDMQALSLVAIKIGLVGQTSHSLLIFGVYCTFLICFRCCYFSCVF